MKKMQIIQILVLFSAFLVLYYNSVNAMNKVKVTHDGTSEPSEQPSLSYDFRTKGEGLEIMLDGVLEDFIDKILNVNEKYCNTGDMIYETTFSDLITARTDAFDPIPVQIFPAEYQADSEHFKAAENGIKLSIKKDNELKVTIPNITYIINQKEHKYKLPLETLNVEFRNYRMTNYGKKFDPNTFDPYEYVLNKLNLIVEGKLILSFILFDKEKQKTYSREREISLTSNTEEIELNIKLDDHEDEYSVFNNPTSLIIPSTDYTILKASEINSYSIRFEECYIIFKVKSLRNRFKKRKELNIPDFKKKTYLDDLRKVYKEIEQADEDIKGADDLNQASGISKTSEKRGYYDVDGKPISHLYSERENLDETNDYDDFA